nr:FecR domain-containing protein [Gammaproteobacteria bacterium]
MGARWVIVLACQRNGVWVLVHVVFIVSTLYLFVAEVHATAVCEPEVARVVSAQGMVELRRANQTNWQAVTLNTLLCAGDMLRVRSRSRAALRLSNESMLRLDQKTTITFPERAADKATSLLDLIKGALHIITRTPKPFKVRTPFLNGAVDGTEFYIGMDENSTTMVLYEGQITTSNAQGRLVLTGHEAVKAIRNQAPQRIAIVKPTDAVQWALYYPTILDYTLNRQNEASAEVAAQPALQAALSYARQGRSYDALSELDQVSQNERTVDFYIAQSSLLLSVGRVDEATASLSQTQKLASNSNSATYNSDVNALQAIIAVIQNDKTQALKLAQQGVDLNDTSPAAWLALSYAQQAHFEIEVALASVQKAVQLDKRNALVWARLAELYMSMSELDQALNAAQKAVELNRDLAKTQTVLGFAYLLKIDTETAKNIFAQAIALDQADPLPRLGMGLVLIREGELEAGRVELEIAASLDPANSLIRSYLGKAYFEEKRYNLASTQFGLAKQRDPKDPTPWFYDAIQKQTQNRPVEALQDIQKSIELNDNRAVYRSKLLLDQDQAGRGSSLARIYDNLGFEKHALMETAKSLSFDPANHSAHRFLSDAYTQIPRHEIARVSELLQAQLLQPINVNPVQPRMAVADLNIITNTGPAVAGFNEFAPLMERN